MKKQITETKSRTVEACDLCERDCGNGFYNDCYVCRRRCCLTCCRGIDFGKTAGERRLIDLYLKVCHECEAIGNERFFVEKMEEAAKDANVFLIAALDSWRAIVQARREKERP